jgi:murein L,D-transpeptidase YcbB/YkuD
MMYPKKTRVVHSKDTQEYMDPGSRGPHVNVFVAIFYSLGYGSSFEREGLVFDEDFTQGGFMVSIIVDFQQEHGLSTDGGIGKETRAKLLEIHGIDLNKITVKGQTKWVMPDNNPKKMNVTGFA